VPALDTTGLVVRVSRKPAAKHSAATSNTLVARWRSERAVTAIAST
jgi:hypothetical protein